MKLALTKMTMIKNKVSVIGLGYVGLPLANAINENKKYKVHGFDISENQTKECKFPASTNPEIINNSEYIIVCVPTPVKSDKKPDLTAIKSASTLISKQLEKKQKIIIESTINPGVCEEIVLAILEKSGLKGGKDFSLAHCPERINPGDPKWNVKNIPRNIGSLNPKNCSSIANFYRDFLDGEITELSSLKATEASKIIENTFRDINIAYVNELAKSFDLMEIDLIEVIKAASNKPFAFLAHYPGCGVGGHCIPVDPYYLIERAKTNGFNHKFLKTARDVNNSMPAYTITLLEAKMKEAGLSYENTKILQLGLAYKANVKDMRESPALKIKEILKEKKAKFNVFDPYIKEQSSIKDLESALDFADIIIIATDHNIFKEIPIQKLKDKKIKIVIDGKNCLNKDAIKKAQIIYKGIGH